MPEIAIPQVKDLINEFTFTASRSSGPGGQNVNKTNSKVTLKFDVVHSVLLSDEQKLIITGKLSTRLTRKGELVITAEKDRSQLQNKHEVLEKLERLLIKIFTPVKPRRPTKVSKAKKQRRLDSKKLQSEKKLWRQKI
jgi:ribosome-associated protein